MSHHCRGCHPAIGRMRPFASPHHVWFKEHFVVAFEVLPAFAEFEGPGERCVSSIIFHNGHFFPGLLLFHTRLRSSTCYNYTSIFSAICLWRFYFESSSLEDP